MVHLHLVLLHSNQGGIKTALEGKAAATQESRCANVVGEVRCQGLCNTKFVGTPYMYDVPAKRAAVPGCCNMSPPGALADTRTACGMWCHNNCGWCAYAWIQHW